MAAAFNPMKETPEAVTGAFDALRAARPAAPAVGDAETGARRPRDLVDRPDMFGLWGKPMRAAAGVDPADAAFIAANAQHWVANAIREEIAMELSNLATVLPSLDPTSPEMTFDRVAQLRRGEIPMTLADLLIWSRRFPAVRDIVTATLGDRPHANSRMSPPSDGGMGRIITTSRGREA